MSGLPERARVVIIGAGIVGNSMAWHLARLGWRDIVLLDKGPLPNPGGSTGHASNFIFLTDHSKEMTALTLDSVAPVQGDGRLHPERRHRGRPDARADGGAQAPDHVVDLVGHRDRAADPGPDQGARPVPRGSVILGGFSTPDVGVVDSLRAGTIMRERAQELGALTIFAGTEVTGIDVQDGHVRGVHTDKGDIAADTVVIACGCWSPRIAKMAGADIPLTPAVHQMISVGPVPQLAGDRRRDHVPDRPRHGHEHVRAPARRRPRSRLVRPPADPAWTPTTSPRSPRRRCRRPSCRSPRTTSRSRWSRRSSWYPTSSVTRRSASGMPSTACSR